MTTIEAIFCIYCRKPLSKKNNLKVQAHTKCIKEIKIFKNNSSIKSLAKSDYEIMHSLETSFGLSEKKHKLKMRNRRVVGLSIYGYDLDASLEKICQLRSLEYLRLTDCKLQSIPRNIIKLTKLKLLNLSYNDLTWPKLSAIDFSGFRNLKFLLLGKNKLTKLPQGFELLENLKLLALEGNKLQSLPDNVSAWT